MAFATTRTGWRVAGVANQSTGYSPDPDCWPAVARALDCVGVPHRGGFTDRFIFRRCLAREERNILRDNDFTYAICGSALPARWNFASD